MNGEMLFLKKLCLTHLLQKHGLEMYYFLWDFEWVNGLGREHYDPVMTEDGPVMMENCPELIVPVVDDGLGKYCCQRYFTSRLTSTSAAGQGCS